jgi:S1-C subfamily serine protease
VSLFDLVVIALVAGLAVGGYRLGFVARVTSWIGLGLGIAVAAAAAPALLDVLRGPDPGSNLLIVTLIFAVIASLGGALGATLGATLRRSIPFGPARQLDHAAGAVAGGLGAVVLVWLLLPAVQDATPEISRQVRNSAIARALDRIGPQAPKSLQALRQRVSEANFPKVFDELAPTPRTGAPPVGQVLAPAVQARVKASTVRVSGVACGRLMEGSGFAAAPDIIVTNAHVVAGVRRATVLRPDGRRLGAQVELFDPQRDLAVLSVPGLGDAPLSVASAGVGDRGAVFGHPEGQVEVDVQPYRVDDRRTAVGRDLYNSAVTRRDVLFLAARLAPGDSGGAVVNESGSVVGVAFAIAPDEPATAFALSDKELRPVLATPRRGAVGTGPCTG